MASKDTRQSEREYTSREKLQHWVHEQLGWPIERIEKETVKQLQRALRHAGKPMPPEITTEEERQAPTQKVEQEPATTSDVREREREEKRDMSKALAVRPSEMAMTVLAQSRERNGTRLVRTSRNGAGTTAVTRATDSTASEIDMLYLRCVNQKSMMQAAVQVVEAMNASALFELTDRQQGEDNLLQEIKTFDRLKEQFKLAVAEFEVFVQEREKAEDEITQKMEKAGISNESLSKGWRFMRQMRRQHLIKFERCLMDIQSI